MPQSERKKLSSAGCALICLSWFYLAVLAALSVTQRVIGERVWFVTWITYLPQHPMLLPAALLLLWALIARSRQALLVNAAAVGIVVFGLLGYEWHPRTASHSDSFRVMTYNVHYLDGGLDPVAKTIAREKPDIVILQEMNPRPGRRQPLALLQKRLPRFRFSAFGELAIGSKYPIRSRELRYISPSVSQRPGLRVTVDIGGRAVHVLAVHLAVAIDDELVRTRWKAIPEYTKHSTAVRSMQTEGLMKWAGELKGPVIIAGDFNTPPLGRIYGRLDRKYRDAFGEAGAGLGHTFRSDLPMLRIDYVFTSHDVVPVRAWVPNSEASDHKPLVAELRVGE